MTTESMSKPAAIFPRPFWIAMAMNLVWINASEVFRYFAFVMPMMREALPGVVDVAPMNLPVFLIWGLWDTVLVVVTTTIIWLGLMLKGSSIGMTIAAGSFVWLTVFVILWLGLFNMNLATPEILGVALPLAWVEMVVAAFITRWNLIRG
jgi:hypothetical protein